MSAGAGGSLGTAVPRGSLAEATSGHLGTCTEAALFGDDATGATAQASIRSIPAALGRWIRERHIGVTAPPPRPDEPPPDVERQPS